MLDFDYKIISKNAVTVVTLSGKLNRESRDQLELCRRELESHDGKVLIIFFKDIAAVDPCVFRDLTLLQQEIRKKTRVFL